MKLQQVRPLQGIVWVRRGFQVFLRQPLAYTALFFSFLFAAFVLLLTMRQIGALAVLVLMPLVSLGFMLATRKAVDGGFPLPSLFVEPLRGPRRQVAALLQIGLAYAVLSMLSMWLADAIDGGKVDALQGAMASGDASAEMMDDPAVQGALITRLLLTVPVSLLFWHAPALAHWGGKSALQSVFFSVVACWRNLGAFVIYFLTWAVAVLVFGVVATLIFTLLAAPQLMALVAFPATLMFVTAFYASLYFTYADCFADDEAEPAAPAALEAPADEA
jgi:hypothetical protein